MKTRNTIAAAGAFVAVLAGCTSTTASSPGTTGTAAVGTTAAPRVTEAAAPDVACVRNVDQVIAAPATAASKTASLPADLVAKLDAAGETSSKQISAPGVIIGVRTPAGTWTEAYGIADPATKAPMAVGMHTRIGSITKTVTSTVILQLVQEGKVSLDDTIDKYVPGVPNGNRITIRMLSNMTSGIASYTFSPKFTDVYFKSPDVVFPHDQALAIGLAEPTMFEPGADYFYSNTNILLLGKVIEKATGQSAEDAFKERIFTPLGLTETVAPGESSAIPEPYSQGFSLQGETATPAAPANATNWNPAWAWTAGELISTMDDLLTYGRALGTGQGVLDPATQAQRLTSFPDAKGYGYGLGLGCSDGWVGHVGELPGYNSTLYYDTTTDTTVVVQANSDMASGDGAKSPLPADNPAKGLPCNIPAGRPAQAIAEALGHPLPFPDQE